MTTTTIPTDQPGSAEITLVQPGSFAERIHDPAYQAFLILRTAFVAAPILFGVDKFFNWMTYWPKYLWVGPPHWIGVSPLHFMYAVGVIEIVAGVLVLVLPRLAPYVVAGWLAGIVTNLIVRSLEVGGHTRVFWDIALRDFGLMLAALALARLATAYAPRRRIG